MKIMGHIRHSQWLGPNVWWDISQIWLEYIKPIGQMIEHLLISFAVAPSSNELQRLDGYHCGRKSLFVAFRLTPLNAPSWYMVDCFNSQHLGLFQYKNACLTSIGISIIKTKQSHDHPICVKKSLYLKKRDFILKWCPGSVQLNRRQCRLGLWSSLGTWRGAAGISPLWLVCSQALGYYMLIDCQAGERLHNRL